MWDRNDVAGALLIVALAVIATIVIARGVHHP